MKRKVSGLPGWSARAQEDESLTDNMCALSPVVAVPASSAEVADTQGHGQSNSNLHGQQSPGIFGVPLQESIRYANVAISLTDGEGKSFVYGYVPIVVAKCGVFLKEKGQSISISIHVQGLSSCAPNKLGC